MKNLTETKARRMRKEMWKCIENSYSHHFFWKTLAPKINNSINNQIANKIYHEITKT